MYLDLQQAADSADIINIYKYDSNKVYHAASNRVPLSSQRCLV
jgi:hypothetical protein